MVAVCIVVLVLGVTSIALLAELSAYEVYLYCPQKPWEIGRQVDLHCSVLKSAYPSKCNTTKEADVLFQRSENGISFADKCCLAEVTTHCTTSHSYCKCNHNSTHYRFEYILALTADSSGYWMCNMPEPCHDGRGRTPTFRSNDGCKKRTVTEISTHLTQVQAVCLPEIWEPMMNVTIHCFLLKSAFPSQCNPGHENKTKFRHSPDGQNFVDVCTLSDILGECTSSGPCECDAANATHHMFHYTFEVNKSRQGDWDCLVPCWVGAVPLTFGQVDCDNKKVFDVNNVTDVNNVVDAESSSSPSCFVFGLSAAGGACVTVAAVAGVYCIMERKSGGQQKAPSAVAAPQNIFPENIPPAEFSPANAPPDNGSQVAGSTGPPTGQAVPIISYDKPDEPSVTGSDASEGVEGSDVDIFSAPFQ